MSFQSFTRVVCKEFLQGSRLHCVTSQKIHFPVERTMSNVSGSIDDLLVAHDPKNKKFFIKLGEDEAKLEYSEEKRENGDVILDMWHTEVPPPLQGKGIAKVLAKEAFEYVVTNSLKMHLSCTYLQKYLKDNPLDKYKSATV